VERWIAAIAIFGMAQEGAKYLVVRYSLYLSPEFDEPVDGIIYMSAAGIGVATYQSFHFLRHGDAQIYLSAGAAQCVVTVLAHASFAGILGYALGRAKFAPGAGHHRSLIIAAGLLAAAILNGAFQVIMDALSVQGLSAAPWRRVFFSFGFAAGVFLITSILMRQLVAISPHAPPPEGS
jgi:RsiW-degrading membrane proteinase PrsW (M82 family)